MARRTVTTLASQRKGKPARRRGVAYARQSRTQDGSESRETQVEELRRLAERHDIEVVAELVEPESTSGFKGRGKFRPEWLRLLEMIRAGEVDVVLALTTDRLSRGGGPGWAPLHEAFESVGGEEGSYVLTPSGFMSPVELDMRATFDREESRKASMRLRLMKARQAERGGANGGTRPYGYTDSKYSAVVAEEAAVLREAFERIVVARESARSVAADFRDREIRTAKGGEWHSGNLRQMLAKPSLAGIREHNVTAERVIDGRPMVVVVDVARYPGSWEPIFTEAEHAAILASVGQRPEVAAPMHLLTGLVRCKLCMGRVGFTVANVTAGKRREVYACTDCRRTTVAAHRLEGYVSERIEAVLQSDDLGAALAGEDHAGGIQAALADLEQDRAALAQASTDHYVTRITPREVFVAAQQGLTDRISRRERRLQRLQRAQRAVAPGGVDQIREDWASFDEQVRNSAARVLIEEIVLAPSGRTGRAPFDPGRVQITWRI